MRIWPVEFRQAILKQPLSVAQENAKLYDLGSTALIWVDAENYYPMRNSGQDVIEAVYHNDYVIFLNDRVGVMYK